MKPRNHIEGAAGGFATACLFRFYEHNGKQKRPSEKIGVEHTILQIMMVLDFVNAIKNNNNEEARLLDGYPWTLNNDSGTAPQDISR